MSWVATYRPVLARLAGRDVPLAMLLGHVQRESGGRPNDRTKLDERGLMQIHPETSKQMGFDHSRMFDPLYSLWAGVEMFKRMADRLQEEFPRWFTVRNDFFWHVVRFEFAIGSGALRKILRRMEGEGFQPRAWLQFTAYLTKNRATLTQLTKHDPVKWAASVDKVFETGEHLLRIGVAVGGGALVVGIAAAVTLYLFWRWNRMEGLLGAHTPPRPFARTPAS